MNDSEGGVGVEIRCGGHCWEPGLSGAKSIDQSSGRGSVPAASVRECVISRFWSSSSSSYASFTTRRRDRWTGTRTANVRYVVELGTFCHHVSGILCYSSRYHDALSYLFDVAMVSSFVGGGGSGGRRLRFLFGQSL